MDWTQILVTGLNVIATLAVCLVTQEKTKALIAYRLEQLEKKVDKHNNLVERTYKLEEQAALLDQRIDQIERGSK